MAAEAPGANLGWAAPPFALRGTDARTHTLAELAGPKGTVVAFICNHCPYVKAIRPRIVRDCRELAAHGIGAIAIMSNDPTEYPEDSFENMRRVAAESGFTFPYVLDATQDVARAYKAVCTPEFFGFNAALELQYHGRLDASKTSPIEGAPRELFNAMVQVARTGQGPVEQTAALGCSIKWKHA